MLAGERKTNVSLRLTAGFSSNVRVCPLMDGTIKPQNIDLEFSLVQRLNYFSRKWLSYEGASEYWQ
jgi:hypothetical protein